MFHVKHCIININLLFIKTILTFKFMIKCLKMSFFNVSRETYLHYSFKYGKLITCNKYIVNWSGLESSSHINPYLCALFLWRNNGRKIL